MPRSLTDRPRLSHPVAFRLTEADHAAYVAKVEASGLKPSAFFRECVLTNRTHIVARSTASGDKQRLQYLFNKTSNNMNQLAHRAHKDYHAGVIGEATYAAVLEQLAALRGELRSALAAVD